MTRQALNALYRQGQGSFPLAGLDGRGPALEDNAFMAQTTRLSYCLFQLLTQLSFHCSIATLAGLCSLRLRRQETSWRPRSYTPPWPLQPRPPMARAVGRCLSHQSPGMATRVIYGGVGSVSGGSRVGSRLLLRVRQGSFRVARKLMKAGTPKLRCKRRQIISSSRCCQAMNRGTSGCGSFFWGGPSV